MPVAAPASLDRVGVKNDGLHSRFDGLAGPAVPDADASLPEGWLPRSSPRGRFLDLDNMLMPELRSGSLDSVQSAVSHVCV